jgi:hypothetical protein
MPIRLKLLFVGILLGGACFSAPVRADYLEIFPVYGYNQGNNLCQIKQATPDSSVNDWLRGDYVSLRECRTENPQVIWRTGTGLIIWPVVASLISLSHFIVYPRIKKTSLLERKVGALLDGVILMGLVIFQLLWNFYFLGSRPYYDHGSDWANLIYMNLIRFQWPLVYLVGYLMFFTGRFFWLRRGASE